MTNFLDNMLSNALGELIADMFGESLDERLDRRALGRAVERAVSRAEQEFAAEYARVDPELASALTGQTRFADLPSVRAALRDLLMRPFHDPAAPLATLRRSFTDVLPQHTERERVDAAVSAFLAILGREVLYIPQLRDLYALSFQKLSAESSRATARHAEAMAETMRQFHDELRQLTAAPPAPQLNAPAKPRERPFHNLPQRSYAQFIGRERELAQLERLLLPHPRSRHFIVTIDGIGGVGKSALALELAYRYRDEYDALPPAERFDAIVWVSAKRTLLTARGIQQRRQHFGTLDDLFRELALVLDRPDIGRAGDNERRSVVERILAEQRTLLLIDNLETVDDEELLTFLRELPDPTKALVTTRHRIDIAYALRLEGMPEADARILMAGEAEARGVALDAALFGEFFRRTGGVPLAIIWSVGLMSLGHSPEVVLRKLGQGQSDIARFCFAESVGAIRGGDAHRLLLALALFERSVSREMLGTVAGLGEDVVGRDDGLATLLQLSLVNQKGDRFKLLPLTHAYAREELVQHPELARELRERWIAELTALTSPFNETHWQQPDRSRLRREGEHVATLARWAEQEDRPDVLLPIAYALGGYYDAIGRWHEVVALHRTCIEYARLLGDQQALCKSLNTLAWIIGQQGMVAEAGAAFAEALALAEAHATVAWQIEILTNMAQLARRNGDFAAARAYCAAARQRLLDVAPEQQPFVAADITIEEGKIARDLGEWQEARKLFQQARDTFRVDIDNPAFNSERAWGAYSQFAYVTHQLGNRDEAGRMYQEALAALREIGSRGFLATVLVWNAELEAERGNSEAARVLAREALELSRKLSLLFEMSRAEAVLARLPDR
jgi:hypothetical protein